MHGNWRAAPNSLKDFQKAVTQHTSLQARYWFIEDTHGSGSYDLLAPVQAALDQPGGKSSNMRAVVDVISDMLKVDPANRIKASGALRRFEELPNSR